MANIPPIRTPFLTSLGNISRDWIKWFQQVQSVVSIANTSSYTLGGALVATANPRVWTLPEIPIAGVPIHFGGVLQRVGLDYNISGKLVTFTFTPPGGAVPWAESYPYETPS